MKTYIAFLRGINVGGHNIIKMDDLSEMFQSIGFRGVKTFIQSGNVVFNSTESNKLKLALKIENHLKKVRGNEIKVFLKTSDELIEIVNSKPFNGKVIEDTTKMYVSFMSEIPVKNSALPLKSDKDGLQIIQIRDFEAFILSFEVHGRFGFPNLFIEKEFGIMATTRNWNTIENMVTRFSF